MDQFAGYYANSPHLLIQRDTGYGQSSSAGGMQYSLPPKMMIGRMDGAICHMAAWWRYLFIPLQVREQQLRADCEF